MMLCTSIFRTTSRLSSALTLHRFSKFLLSNGKTVQAVDDLQHTSTPFKFKQACLFATKPNAEVDGDCDAPHFKRSNLKHPLVDLDKKIIDLNDFQPSDTPYTLPHPIWSDEHVDEVKVSHYKPQNFVDWTAYIGVQTLRLGFDIISLYKVGTMDESKWLTRIILLETVAGVPGMVAAMTRHLQSLRSMERDYGWIHTLLEEAENERMHLLTALVLKQPGKIFRGSVLVLQGVFWPIFFISYMISPRLCHRFVGYLEEEAVKTYSFAIECIDAGKLPMWERLPAPPIAKQYWKLEDGSMMRDVLLAIRADEAHHRLVNHTFGSLQKDKQNPFSPGE